MMDDSSYANRLVKTLLEVIILSMLVKKPQHGYKIIEDIHRIYNVFLSPGTLYPTLYDLKKRGIVVVKEVSNKKVYYPTLKGENEFLEMKRKYKSAAYQIFKILDEF